VLIVKYSLPLLFPSSLCLSLSLRYPPHLPSLPPSLYLSLPPLSLSLRYSEDGAYWRMSIEHASWSPRAGMSALVFSQTQRTSLWVSVCLSLSVSESVFVCLSLPVCLCLSLTVVCTPGLLGGLEGGVVGGGGVVTMVVVFYVLSKCRKTTYILPECRRNLSRSEFHNLCLFHARAPSLSRSRLFLTVSFISGDWRLQRVQPGFE